MLSEILGALYIQQISEKKHLMTGYYSPNPENPNKESTNYIIKRLTEEERLKNCPVANPAVSKSIFKDGRVYFHSLYEGAGTIYWLRNSIIDIISYPFSN